MIMKTVTCGHCGNVYEEVDYIATIEKARDLAHENGDLSGVIIFKTALDVIGREV